MRSCTTNTHGAQFLRIRNFRMGIKGAWKEQKKTTRNSFFFEESKIYVYFVLKTLHIAVSVTAVQYEDRLCGTRITSIADTNIV